MAQIDELIAAMTARRATALILQSDRPAQLDFHGTTANGALVPATLLREMLCEILPAEQKFQLLKADNFEFVHPCSSGLMLVQISGRDAQISLVVSHYQVNSPQPPYSPVVGSRYALINHKTPDLSKLGSAVANSTQFNSAQLPTVGALPTIGAILGFCFLLRWLTVSLGLHAPGLFFLGALAIVIDAHRLGVRRGLVDGWANIGPWEWFALSAFFGFIGIPAYLVARPVYKSALPPARVPPP